MFRYCNYPFDCYFEPTSESEDEYDVEACVRCKKNPKSDYSNCHEYKIKQKKMAKGKFGLAYVIETPNQTITKPTGWQVEFQDTPSKVENNCAAMMRWVSRPPLGECSAFSDYPKECAGFLDECELTKLDRGCKKCQKETECSCKSDHVCVICEKCKINTSRAPRKSTAYKNDIYSDGFKQKDKNYRKVCFCDRLNCKFCQEEKQPKWCKEKQKSNFTYCRDEGDLDYVPKRDGAKKKAKNTQTKPLKCKNYEELNRVNVKEEKSDKPLVHKIETKAVVDIRFSEKGVEVKNTEATQTSTLKQLEDSSERQIQSGVGVKKTGTPQTSTLKQLEDNSERKFQSGDKRVETLQKASEKRLPEGVEQLKEIVEIPERIVEVAGEEQDERTIAEVELNEDSKKADYKIINHKHLSKREIFTDDMTPMQKLKLALKIQKQEIFESKIAQKPPETIIQTLNF